MSSVEVEIAKDEKLTPKDKSAMLALYYVLIGRQHYE